MAFLFKPRRRSKELPLRPVGMPSWQNLFDLSALTFSVRIPPIAFARFASFQKPWPAFGDCLLPLDHTPYTVKHYKQAQALQFTQSFLSIVCMLGSCTAGELLHMVVQRCVCNAKVFLLTERDVTTLLWCATCTTDS
jgi:hypothetical protein